MILKKFQSKDLLLVFLPIEDSITNVTTGYLKAVAPGIAFITIFTCLRCYSEGMTLTKPIFIIAFTGVLLNIPLDLIFVYGWFGLPQLGGMGCGVASSIVSYSLAILFFHCLIHFFNHPTIY